MKEKDVEIIKIERIKVEEGCLCKHCHGPCREDIKSVLAECVCAQRCKLLACLQGIRDGSRWFSYDNTHIYTSEWVIYADLAKELGLSSEAVTEYQKRGVKALEKIGDFYGAKKYSENFGLTELAEYYQKLINIKGHRPK